ncbi:hypothetical protein T11_517, partial [Trichinella zimbabwensis]
MALTESVREVKWICQVLVDLGKNQLSLTPFLSSNLVVAFLTKNPQHHR